MRFVFIMDPVSHVIVDEDTSFSLMLEAQRQGHEVLHTLIHDVGLDRDRVVATVRTATMERADPPIRLGEDERVDLATVDAVFVRKDPPFNEAYWWLTLILELLQSKTVVVNSPRGLREANEKLYACAFPALVPTSIVASDKKLIRQFVNDMGGRAVIKPIDGHGGDGVFLLDASDKNVNGLIEATTRNGSKVALVQEYLPAVVEGDKRVLLLEGEPLGAILRVPQGDDLRSNIHVGGSVVAAEITKADQQIIKAMQPRLGADGLFFVGLDVIGGKLTEVNVTSPTGIQQASRLSGDNLEEKVIKALVSRVRRDS